MTTEPIPTTIDDVEALAFEGQALAVRPHNFDIEIPDAGMLLVQQLKGLLNQAEAFLSVDAEVAAIQCVDADSYKELGTERDVRKRLTSELDKKRLEVSRPFGDAQAKIKAFVDQSITALNSAVSKRDAARVQWKREQERLRLEEENRRKAILAEEERKLKEAAAKIEAEAKAKADKLRADAEAAIAAGNVGKAAKLQERADAVIEAADTKIEIKQQQAASLPSASVASSVPDGGYRKTYKPRLKEKTKVTPMAFGPGPEIEVTGLEQFILAVADGIRNGSGFPPTSYILPNMVAIGKYCDSTAKGGSFRLPGFELVEDEIPVSRRGAR